MKITVENNGFVVSISRISNVENGEKSAFEINSTREKSNMKGSIWLESEEDLQTLANVISDFNEIFAVRRKK